MHNRRVARFIQIVVIVGLFAGITACTRQTEEKLGTEAKVESFEEAEQTGNTFEDIWSGDSAFAEEVTFDTLTVSVSSQGKREDIKAFQQEDTYYFLLPTYADTSHIRLNISPEQYEITYQDNEVSPWKEMRFLQWDMPSAMTIKEKQGDYEESQEVVFLKSEHINTMFITTESGSLDAVNEDKEYKEAGTMRLFTEKGDSNYDGELEYISGRGNQTWDFEKKPYQIKLSKKADLLQMGKAKKWVLLANTLDDSFIRNKIVYDMAKAVDLPYSPESEFMDLYVNGNYMGNYQISEKIEIDEERVDIKDLEKETEQLNADLDFKNMQSHEAEDQNQKWIDMVNNPEDITGGYLLERDYWEKYGPERSGFKTTMREHFVVKSPENASRAEVDYIREVVQQIEDAIYAEDGKNPNTGIYYTDYIDLASWVKKYMIEEITKNEGAGTTSSWFYKPANEESTLVYAGPVWDYDKSLGRYELSCYQDPFGLSYLSYHHYSSPWYKQLYSHEDFQNAVKQYYQEEFQAYLRDLTDERIDVYADTVRASAYMDHIRWAELTEEWQYTDFDESIEALKQFISQRTDFLDEVWVQDKIYYMVQFKVDGAIYAAEYVEPGETVENVPDLSEERDDIIGWFYEGTDEPWDANAPINEDEILYIK